LAWGAVGWGLGSLTSGWGYGTSYYNPYYVQAAAVPYDYSQPVVVNTYYDNSAEATATGPTDPAAAPQPETNPGTQLFDEGLALFKSGDYQGALARFDASLKQLPGDPVVHEVRALTLFALGQYAPAAASLNALLASAPGMDWTTLSSLYGNTADYQTQLRKLEQFCRDNPQDAGAYFVLAYQYLVIGSKDAAVDALKVVVANQPKDSTAKRMLDALAPPEASSPAVAQAATATPTTPADASTTAAASPGPSTDLVGKWQAKADGTTIDLAITADSNFTWKATQKGQPPVSLAGQLTASADQLALETEKQGTMAGTVKSVSPNEWQFVLDGAPPNDPGLKFARVN